MERRMTARVQSGPRPWLAMSARRWLGIVVRHTVAWLLLSWSVVASAAAQDKIVKSYLDAAATGQPEALLEFLHPGEVVDVRNRVLKALDDDAAHGSHAVRDRLFGN